MRKRQTELYSITVSVSGPAVKALARLNKLFPMTFGCHKIKCRTNAELHLALEHKAEVVLKLALANPDLVENSIQKMVDYCSAEGLNQASFMNDRLLALPQYSALKWPKLPEPIER